MQVRPPVRREQHDTLHTFPDWRTALTATVTDAAFDRRKRPAIGREMLAILSLAGPILGAQIAQTSMGFVDTVMAGRVGATDLAAVAIGSSLWVPLYLFVSGVILATTPNVAGLYGARNLSGIGPLVRQSLWLGIALGLVAFVLLRSTAPLLDLMGIDGELRPQVLHYLDGVSWGFPAIGVFQVLRCCSEGMSITRPVMVISFTALALNIPMNFIFIYGKFGLPAMGGAGCGWATGCVMWFMLITFAIYTRSARAYRPTRMFERFSAPHPETIHRLLRLGLPIGCAIFIEVSIFAVIALMIGSLGPEAISAHQIALNFASLAFMVPLSVGLAITVRTGQALGAGQLDSARFASVAGIALNLGIACLLSGTMFLFPGPIARIYTTHPEVIELAMRLLFFAALFQFSDALQVSAACALRGYRDTKIPMYITLLAYWGIGLPIGYSLGMSDFWGPAMGPAGLWIGLVAGLSMAAVLFSLRLWRVSKRPVDFLET